MAAKKSEEKKSNVTDVDDQDPSRPQGHDDGVQITPTMAEDMAKRPQAYGKKK